MGSIYKRVLCMLTLSLFFTFTLPIQPVSAQDDAYVSYNDFYQNLAPYGQWIEDPQYGYVWTPNAGDDFRPYYTSGHWAMTDYGNTWISDYPWGWACFHYGRWTYDNYYGWIWIPGSNWGPAWVSWRNGDGYYGWAPLGPGYEFGSSPGDYYCPNDWWVFIPPQYIYGGNYYHYWTGPRDNVTIINNTTFINNTYSSNNVTYVSGPHASDVEQVTHTPVQVFHITNSSNLNTRVHNSNNTIKMYRPAEIRPATAVGGQRVAPPNVIAAPQAIRTQQAVNTGQTNGHSFRDDVPKSNNNNTDQVGTHINETARPTQQPARNNTVQPYEWDVNRSVPQQQQQNNSRPQQQAPQQPQQSRQQFQQQNMQQQPRQQQSAPQPQRAPQQQQQSRPAPASSQQRQGGGGGGRR